MTATKLTRLNVDGRVVRVRDCERKLGADVPSFARFLVAIVEVDRDHVVRLTVRIAHRKEQDVPAHSPLAQQATLWDDSLPDEEELTIYDRRRRTLDSATSCPFSGNL